MRFISLLGATLLLLPRLAAAQPRAVPPRRATCDRVATTSFTFGRTGGNIRPDGWRLARDGTLSRLADGVIAERLGVVPREAVRRIARLAWTNGFAALPASPTRPTHNPDAARQFVEVRSACAAHHVEYAAGDEARAFRAVRALLDSAVTEAR